MSKHTAEPWGIDCGHLETGAMVGPGPEWFAAGTADIARAVACVNELTGVADPAALMADVRDLCAARNDGAEDHELSQLVARVERHLPETR